MLQAEKWSIGHLIDRQALLVAKLKEVWEINSKPESEHSGADDDNDDETEGLTGRELNQRWEVGARHALHRKDGTWYHRLERFPGALFDAHGYLLFETARDLETCPGISIGKEKNWLHVSDGIATVPGYIRVKLPPLD